MRLLTKHTSPFKQKYVQIQTNENDKIVEYKLTLLSALLNKNIIVHLCTDFDKWYSAKAMCIYKHTFIIST